MGYDKGERERGGQNEGRCGRARFTRAHTHTSRPCAAVFPVLLSELPLGLLLGISHPPGPSLMPPRTPLHLGARTPLLRHPSAAVRTDVSGLHRPCILSSTV